MKLEQVTTKHFQLLVEYRLYRIMQGGGKVSVMLCVHLSPGRFSLLFQLAFPQ